jgi:hypothetical protein
MPSDLLKTQWYDLFSSLIDIKMAVSSDGKFVVLLLFEISIIIGIEEETLLTVGCRT